MFVNDSNRSWAEGVYMSDACEKGLGARNSVAAAGQIAHLGRERARYR